MGHLLRQRKGATWSALCPANGTAVSRTPGLSSGCWEHVALREPQCGARMRFWEPVLMFLSAFEKRTVLIPKVLWEFFLFALYHFSGEEARNRW